MTDPASKAASAAEKKIEKRLKSIYSEAASDIDAKLQDFNNKYKSKESIHLQEVKDGKMTQAEFDDWKAGQVFIGKQWQDKKKSIEDTLYNANKAATKIVNGETQGVFGAGASYANYQMEHGAGVNFGFGIYDSSTVAKLVKDNPDLLPQKTVNKTKDEAWNSKKITAQVTQGIIQGEDLGQITKRLSKNLSNSNMKAMQMYARTAMTGAQNAGRVHSYQQAKKLGIEIEQQWMATLDGHTRDSHADIDGEIIQVGDTWHPQKFSNGCRYPGDPMGPPAEVYNCRCTLVANIPEYPAEYERRDNISGKPIKNMSYKEWEKSKKDMQTKYDKWGGQQIVDKLMDSNSAFDFKQKATHEEWDQIKNLALINNQTAKEYLDSALKDLKPVEEAPAQIVPKSQPVPVTTAEVDISTWIDKCKSNPNTKQMLEIESKAFAGMSDDEKQALRTYTGSSYEKMNDYLRRIGAGESQEEAKINSGIRDELIEKIKLCDQALTSQSLDRDMVLRRGTDLGDIAGLFMQGDFKTNMNSLRGKSAEELNSMFQGQVGTYFGFTSTSSQWDKGFDGYVEVVINAPKGTPAQSIMSISQFGTGEGETLLNCNTRVICEKIEKSDGHEGSKIRMFLSIIID